MIRDQVRTGAYVEALRRAVKPGDVVIDLGTGTGIFALIACQLGARHVYAVDPNPLVEVGKQIAAANGYSDRITFIRGIANRVQFPELADVVVGDLRGSHPLVASNLATYAALAQRLKPGGIMIPQQDRVYAALIQAPARYAREVLQPWADNPYQLDMRAALPLILNAALISGYNPARDEVILPSQLWGAIDYPTLGDHPGPVQFDRTLSWQVEAAGAAHFLYIWFETELYDGVGFSNAPESSERRPWVYGNVYPLAQPLDLLPGQRVALTLKANLVGQVYVFQWATRLFADADAAVPLQQFNQSTFFATLLQDVHKRAAQFKPTLTPNGRVQAFILGEMARGEFTVAAIAQAAGRQFPDVLPDDMTALAEVARLSQIFSQ
ncbi:MAG: methyltransferase domain-containing protein [Chloroflexi bacterium]|nr:methyltransferase domain-containing protein [Chloroflexota bacterium]